MQSVTATTSTTGATIQTGTIVDADSLTSLTLDATYANITIGAIGGSGSAEALSAVTLSAANGATVTVGNITADSTDSASDNAMVITGSTDSTSTINTGAITNTFGTINMTVTGAGTVDADVGTDIFDAAGITLTTSAGGQYDELQSSGDITITATNSTALTLMSWTQEQPQHRQPDGFRRCINGYFFYRGC